MKIVLLGVLFLSGCFFGPVQELHDQIEETYFGNDFTSQLQFLLIGSWKQNIIDLGFSSHNDFIMIPFMFGIFPLLLLLRRWYSAINFGFNSPLNSPSHIYSLMIISMFFTLIHYGMAMTVYPMIFTSIMLLRIEYQKDNSSQVS